MKRASVLLVVLLSCAVTSAHAQTTVQCRGTAAGGSGLCLADPATPRRYVYQVIPATTPLPSCTVFVGTHDPDASHYSAWCLPAGWTWSILPTSALDPGYGMQWDDYESFTPHGTVSGGPTGVCPYVILFAGPAPGSFDLGFDHPGYPHDASWLYASPPNSDRSNWTLPVGSGTGPVHGPQAVSDCQIDPYTDVLTQIKVGHKDNFATADGVEPATPGAALLALINTNCPLGPLTCHPGDAVCEFDCGTIDRCFGHTFTGQWTMAGEVYSAALCFKLKAGTGGDNDNISFREEGVGVWGMLIKDLRNACVGVNTWNPGEVFEYCLNLGTLPVDARGITDVRGLLADGDLDFYFSDDTQIDYLELRVYTCCEQCIATGDINSDGVPLTIGDLTFLMDFVNNGGPAPQPPCIADLNDDGYVDQYDIDILNDYFTFGFSVFPQYPVITECVPDTVRGCCCTSRARAVRSSYNCGLEGGAYSGDGILCIDAPLPPMVTATVPAANAVGVSKTDPITVTFNTDLADFGSGVSITGAQSGSHLWMASFDPGTNTLSITSPFPAFISGEQVTVVLIGADLRTDEWVPMCTNYSWSFTITTTKGSGTYGSPVVHNLGTERHPADLAPADFDGDGDPDLVVVFSDSAGNVDSCALWSNDGSGGGTVSGVYPVGYKGTASGKPASIVGTADFNGDGLTDVALVKELDDGDYISVLMTVGTKGSAASMSPAGVYPVGFKGTTAGKPTGIVADVDDDNDPDIIVVDNTDQGNVQAAVCRNLAGGTSWAFDVYPIPFTTAPVGAPSLTGGDVDGDGDQDFIVVQTLSDTVFLAVMASMGTSGYSCDGVYPVGYKGSTTGKPASIIGDIDGDADLDVIVVDAIGGADSLALLTNDGSGGYSCNGVYPVGYKGTASGKPASIIADVDGDGDLDLVVCEAFSNGDSLAVHLNNGSGGYTCDGVYPAGFKGSTSGKPQKIIASELDGGAATKSPAVSGGLDLIHANFETCSLAVMFNQPIVSCACDCHADPSQCDGLQDVTDVVLVVNVSFRGAAAIPDPNPACPYERTDTNCSGSTDVVDVVKMVNVAFRGANPATEFCDPCP